MQEMLSASRPSSSTSSSQSGGNDGLDSGAEALARLLTFKDDTEDQLAIAAAEKNVLQRRKDALQTEVRKLKSALLASQVQCAEQEEQVNALKTYNDEAQDAKVKELENRIRVLEEQNAQHVRARIDCPCCSL